LIEIASTVDSASLLANPLPGSKPSGAARMVWAGSTPVPMAESSQRYTIPEVIVSSCWIVIDLVPVAAVGVRCLTD
jgi:hypothetical protein